MNSARTETAATPTTNGAAQLLTADQLADRWQVPRAHVYRLSREGLIPTVKLGRYRRFRVAEVEAFEASGGVAADERAV